MSTLAEALAPRSDQLNADDLIPGPRVLKITDARISSEERQKRIVLNFEGDQGKPFKPCKTMGRAMVLVWAITDEKQLIGKSIRVYRDPQVKFGDQGEVGGIRISHMSDIDKPASVKLTVSQGKKAIFKFDPLVTEASQANDAAAKWAAAYIAKLPSLLTIEEVNEFAGEKAAKLEELREKRPQLHSQVTAALTVRRSELTDTDPFADQPASPANAPAAAPDAQQRSDEQAGSDPFAPEGRDDTEMGESHNGAEDNIKPEERALVDGYIAEIQTKWSAIEVNAIVNGDAQKLSDEAFDRVRVAASEQIDQIRAKAKAALAETEAAANG